MTIQVKPEQLRIIGQAIEAGLIETPDEAVELGVETIRQRLEGHPRTAATEENLAALFANSPFAGLDIDFKRDQDPGRPLEFFVGQ